MALSDFFQAILSPFKMLFGDPDRDRILREGRSAVAKIIDLGESGAGYVTINDQPYVKLELEVYEDGKEPYRTTLSTIIPRLAVPQFQPGRMLNVKIDPTNPLKVVFDTTASAETKPTVGNTDQKAIENGKPGFAEILEMRKTDKVKNNNPVFVLKLEVTGEGIEKYSFDKEIPLPEFAMPYVTVGKKYACLIDPVDKTKVQLDIKFN